MSQVTRQSIISFLFENSDDGFHYENKLAEISSFLSREFV